MNNQDPKSNFVWFNFRGIVRFLRKDTIEKSAFLNGLINNQCSAIEKDSNQNIMVCEDYEMISLLFDLHTIYLETNNVSYNERYAMIAQRLGFDQEFVNKMKTSERERKLHNFARI